MKYIIILLALLCLTACQSTVEPSPTETDPSAPESIAETDAAPPVAEEETVIPVEPESPVEPETYGEVIIPAPSFTEYKWTLDKWGDLVQQDGEGKGFVEEDMVPGSFALVQNDLPDSWELTATTAQDIPRADAGMFNNKRMEYYSFLYRTPEHPETAEERVNSAGYTYYSWTEGDPDVNVAQWHHCEFPVAAPMEETYYFHIYFLTFTENSEAADPADYFDNYIFPAIDNLRIEFSNVGWASLPIDYTIPDKGNPAVTYVPVKEKLFKEGADVVEIPAPTFTDMRISSNRWGDYVEDPLNPERAFIPAEALTATAWFTMALPDSWEVDEVNHHATDIPRQNASVYSILRMRFGHTLYLTSENPRERLAATNQHGTKYYYWETTDTARDLYVEVAVPCYEQEYLYRLCFCTFLDDPYAEDPVDYFETHVQPVLDSIRVEIAQ